MYTDVVMYIMTYILQPITVLFKECREHYDIPKPFTEYDFCVCKAHTFIQILILHLFTVLPLQHLKFRPII